MSSRRVSEPDRKAIRVAIVDDHPLWRDTLRRLLELDGLAEVVIEASDGDEAINDIDASSVDVVVMDINLPNTDGIVATETLISADPTAKVLVLASSDEKAQVVDAIRAGASGYLVKTAAPDEVVDAITRIHKGELVFPESVASVVLQELRRKRSPLNLGPLDGSGIRELIDDPDSPNEVTQLSEREKEVLSLMAQGLSNQSIADRLFLGAKTVEVHVRNIFMKLGLEPDSDVNRRVLAVVTYLQSRRADDHSQATSTREELAP